MLELLHSRQPPAAFLHDLQQETLAATAQFQLNQPWPAVAPGVHHQALCGSQQALASPDCLTSLVPHSCGGVLQRR